VPHIPATDEVGQCIFDAAKHLRRVLTEQELRPSAHRPALRHNVVREQHLKGYGGSLSVSGVVANIRGSVAHTEEPDHDAPHVGLEHVTERKRARAP